MNDLYRLSLRPHASAKELVAVSRLFTGLLLGAALLLGSAIDPKSLDTWVMFINSALVVFPLPLAWLKWFWWRTNIYAEMVGVLGAFPAGYFVWFGSETLGVPAFGNLHVYPFWVGFGILFGLGSLATLLATLLFRPEPPDVLLRFYKDVRPMGWWGPVRARLDDEDAAEVRAETRRDLVACVLGIVFYFSLVVGFFSLMGGRLPTAAALGLAAVVSGGLFYRAIVKAKR